MLQKHTNIVFGNSKRGGEPGPLHLRSAFDKRLDKMKKENPNYTATGNSSFPGPGTYKVRP